MPIALLKFPYDLLRDVFQQCNPYELYCLSKCSKRTQKTVMLGGIRNNWRISSSDLNSIFVFCGDDRYAFRHTTDSDQYFKTRRWCEFTPSSLFMSIDIPDGGFIDLFLYFLDTFRINSVGWLGNTEENMYALLQIGKITIDRNMAVKAVIIRNVENQRDVMRFMPLTNQMNITYKIQCEQKFPSNFRHEFVRYPENIHLKNSFWFNTKQLLNCPCTKIELEDSMLRNQDLDLFLREWTKKEGFPNLRSLIVESKNIRKQPPILGMVPPIRNAGPPGVRAVYRDANRMLNAVRVTKDDGTFGWLKVELGRWRRLEFIVKEIDPSDDEEELDDEESDDEESEEEVSNEEESDDEN
ncbi:unnamed protein product [Caenorhabditis nigoni]